MRKYVSDLSSKDILIVEGREVYIDIIRPETIGENVWIEGYFDDNGDPFEVSVPVDFSFRVAL